MHSIRTSFKFFLVVTIFVVIVECLSAATNNSIFKITQLNTPSITIGGKSLKVGDKFSGTSNIKWINDKQLMEVEQVGTGELYLFSKKVMDSKGAILSISDFFLRTNQASHRAIGTSFKLKRSPVANQFPEKRIALIIGNSNYYNLSYLRNAQKDASDIADVLLSLGFDILEAYETNYEELHTALNQFSELAKGYGAALFYFAGHGLQDEGKNYLIPINAKLRYRSELRDFLHGDDVVQRLASTHVPTQLIFIDACRNAKSIWDRSTAEGLARMEGGPGAVIVFSTESGKIAMDGDGENSPFAAALIKNLKLKKTSFSETINSVVRDTYESTGHKQYPLQMGTPLTEFNFNPPSLAYNNFNQNLNQEDAKKLNQKGLSYYNSKDYEEAAKYFRMAADRGFESAMCNLGVMYELGEGVKQNFDESFRWYKKAADLGEATAMNNLAFQYENGRGVAQNFEEALRWYKKAADFGEATAMDNLGYLYENGIGVKQNLYEAQKWYEKAVNAGNSKAQSHLETLRKRIDAYNIQQTTKKHDNTITKITLVDSKDDEPLIGATLIHLRANKMINGMASDIDGNFKVNNLKLGDVLRLSYVGYKTKEITLGGDYIPNTIKLSLDPGNHKKTESVTVNYVK